MERDTFLTFLGLVRRAGKLACGEEQTIRARKLGKARLILLAEDASVNAEDRAETISHDRSCPLLKLPYTKETLSDATGTAPFAMAAVCDSGFAEALQKKYRTEQTGKDTGMK